MKFKDALDLSIEKMRSEDFIKMIREEDELMVSHLHILTKINEMGFLTLESQGGHEITGSHIQTGKPFETRERAYLMGFMPEKKAAEFIKMMGLFSDKNVINIFPVEDDMNIPRRFDIPLTTTHYENDNIIYTSTSTILPRIIWEQYREEARLNKSEKVVYLLCWDSKWCRNASARCGLFNDILKSLEKIY